MASRRAVLCVPALLVFSVCLSVCLSDHLFQFFLCRLGTEEHCLTSFLASRRKNYFQKLGW